MKLAYIDESIATQESEWLVLAAFIIDSEDWTNLDRVIESGVGGYNWRVVLNENLKNLRRPPEDAFDRGEPKELSHRVYESLDEEVDYKVISTLINRDEYDSSVWDGFHDDPYIQAYVFLLERLHLYLHYLDYREKAMVFIDSRDSRQDKAMMEAHQELKEDGTDHVDFSNINHMSIPLDDEHSYGLQLADWMVKAIKDAVIDGYTTEFFDHVKPHLHRSDDGDIVGYGLKVYPETWGELHEIGRED